MVATAIYSVTIVLWKETAFPLCIAIEKRWNRNVVSRVFSVIVVILLLIIIIIIITASSILVISLHSPSLSHPPQPRQPRSRGSAGIKLATQSNQFTTLTIHNSLYRPRLKTMFFTNPSHQRLFADLYRYSFSGAYMVFVISFFPCIFGVPALDKTVSSQFPSALLDVVYRWLRLLTIAIIAWNRKIE